MGVGWLWCLWRWGGSQGVLFFEWVIVEILWEGPYVFDCSYIFLTTMRKKVQLIGCFHPFPVLQELGDGHGGADVLLKHVCTIILLA